MSMGEAIGYIIGGFLGLIICLIIEIILEKKKNRKLQDKVEMLDFFYEGNGFKRRGFVNSIQIEEYIVKLEKESVKAASEIVHYKNDADFYKATNEKLREENEKIGKSAGFMVNLELTQKMKKAKEIITEFLSWEKRVDYDYSEYDAIKDKAENFLKEKA